MYSTRTFIVFAIFPVEITFPVIVWRGIVVFLRNVLIVLLPGPGFKCVFIGCIVLLNWFVIFVILDMV